MKTKKTSSFSLYIVSALVSFIATLILVIAILHCINSFVKINWWINLLITVGTSALSAGIIDIILYKSAHSIRESKIGFWLGKNYPKLMLAYLIVLLLFVSVTNHTIWSADEVNDVLSTEWTIFGLSLTIFLVWNVLIVEYLRKKQPKASDQTDFISKYKFLLEKRSYAQEIDTTFSTVIFLSINLIILLISTGLVYIVHTPESIFTQNVVICSFYFTTNTIALLFTDILQPLKHDKETLKKPNSVQKDEIEAAKAGIIIQKMIEIGFEKIKSNEELTEEQKKECILQYANFIQEALLKLKNDNAEGESSK